MGTAVLIVEVGEVFDGWINELKLLLEIHKLLQRAYSVRSDEEDQNDEDENADADTDTDDDDDDGDDIGMDLICAWMLYLLLFLPVICCILALHCTMELSGIFLMKVMFNWAVNTVHKPIWWRG